MLRPRVASWRAARSPLPPLGVLAEDFSLLVRKRRVRSVRTAKPRLLS